MRGRYRRGMEQGLILAAISLASLTGAVLCFARCTISTSILARIVLVLGGAALGAVGLFTVFDLPALP